MTREIRRLERLRLWVFAVLQLVGTGVALNELNTWKVRQTETKHMPTGVLVNVALIFAYWLDPRPFNFVFAALIERDDLKLEQLDQLGYVKRTTRARVVAKIAPFTTEAVATVVRSGQSTSFLQGLLRQRLTKCDAESKFHLKVPKGKQDPETFQKAVKKVEHFVAQLGSQTPWRRQTACNFVLVSSTDGKNAIAVLVLYAFVLEILHKQEPLSNVPSDWELFWAIEDPRGVLYAVHPDKQNPVTILDINVADATIKLLVTFKELRTRMTQPREEKLQSDGWIDFLKQYQKTAEKKAA